MNTLDWLDKYMELSALIRLEAEAYSFAGNPGNDSETEIRYRAFEERSPISDLISQLRRRYAETECDLSPSRDDADKYCLFRYACDPGFRHEFRQLKTELTNRVKDRLNQLDEWIESGLKHFILEPPSVVFNSMTLEGHSLHGDEFNGKDLDQKSVSSAETQRIAAAPDGLFQLELDPSRGLTCRLEIGAQRICGILESISSGLPDIVVFVNGTDRDCRRVIQWESDLEFSFTSGFRHPEFTSVSITSNPESNTFTLIFWNSVQRNMIDRLARLLIPLSAQRLRWWTHPNRRLGGMSPWQCMQKRMDQDVLDYLMETLLKPDSPREGGH